MRKKRKLSQTVLCGLLPHVAGAAVVFGTWFGLRHSSFSALTAQQKFLTDLSISLIAVTLSYPFFTSMWWTLSTFKKRN
jgi:hypothetical protein